MLQTPASDNVSKFTACWTIHRIKQWSKNTGGGPGKKKSIFRRYHISEVTAVSWENKSNVKGLTCTALTGVGELKALVRVGSVGVELQPQVVGGAVQDEPHQLVPSEGTQGPRRAVFSIIDLGRTHSTSTLVTEFCSYASNFNKKSKLWNTRFHTTL